MELKFSKRRVFSGKIRTPDGARSPCAAFEKDVQQFLNARTTALREGVILWPTRHLDTRNPALKRKPGIKKETEMKMYTLNAREHETSIDFYEIAKDLSRKNPIAFVTAGANQGYVLVHKQLMRQAMGKRSAHGLYAGTKPDEVAKLSADLRGLFYPGNCKPSYPWQFESAFAFHVEDPADFSAWKKWAKHVRDAPWNCEEREYTVSFPEV